MKPRYSRIFYPLGLLSLDVKLREHIHDLALYWNIQDNSPTAASLMIFDHSSGTTMEPTKFESPVHLLRQLRWSARLTYTSTGVFRVRKEIANSREYAYFDNVLDTLEHCGDYLAKVSNLVEELALSGREFPVELREEICHELEPYNNLWSSNCITEECADSSLDTLRQVYDDLSLHACVDFKIICLLLNCSWLIIQR